MKKAVVTGATGCVGYHVVLELLLQGWDVTVLHRQTSNTSIFDASVHLIEVDLYELNSILEALPTEVDAVFHLAANVAHHVDENQWKDNVLVTKNLVAASLEKKVKRFIFTSTAAARYARDTSSPNKLKDEIPCGYAHTKRLAELEVMKAVDLGLDAVVLQPTIVLGEYDFHKNYSQLFQETILTHLRAALPGRLEFADAKKIAKAHVSAFHFGKTDSFYVLGGAYLSWFQLQQVISEVTGMKPPLFVLPNWSLYVIALMQKIGHKLFGIHPQMTKDLIWLLGDEDPIQRHEVRNAIRDLEYNNGETDIKAVCQRMNGWINNQ